MRLHANSDKMTSSQLIVGCASVPAPSAAPSARFSCRYVAMSKRLAKPSVLKMTENRNAMQCAGQCAGVNRRAAADTPSAVSSLRHLAAHEGLVRGSAAAKLHLNYARARARGRHAL